MKRINIVILFFLFMSTVVHSQEAGVRFAEDLSWEEVKAKAKQENRYIFLDFYATQCDMCKYMETNVYTDKGIGEFFSDNFISVKVQMDSSTSDSDHIKSWYATAKRLADQLNITAYPTLIFFSPSGEPVHRTEGIKMGGKDLLSDANNAMDPGKQYYTLLKQFESGKLPRKFLKSLVFAASGANQKEVALNAARQYINGSKEQELYTKDNIEFISHYTKTSKDRGFRLFLTHTKKINDIAGENTAERKIINVITSEEITPFVKENGPSPDWTAIEKKVVSKYGDLGQEAVLSSRLFYYWNAKDWSNLGKYYPPYFDKYVSRSVIHVNNISWVLFEHITDREILESGIRAMKYDIEVFGQSGPDSYDTYANLLYKTGNKTEAIKWEQKAIKANPNEKIFVETLEKMKNDLPTWPVN